MTSSMSPRPFRILVVCTANICRSVMGELMIRRAAAPEVDVEVWSCGFLFDDEPASDAVIAVLDERDLDARDHRSRKFAPSMLDDIDLVVTMERAHARELTVAVEGAFDRIHTLGALVAGLRAVAQEDLKSSPAMQIAEIASARSTSELLGNGPDEVEDPHGKSKRVHRKTADRIENLSYGLIDALFPSDS